MAKYGTSLNVAEDLEAEKAAEEAKKKQTEEKIEPRPKPDVEVNPRKDDDSMGVTVGDDWKYLVGALIAMALIVGMGWYLLNSTPQVPEPVEEVEVATAADVDATISQLLGEKLADSQNKTNVEPIHEPANSSNHSVNMT